MTKLLTSWTPLDLDSKLIKEDADKNGGKMMLRGILQRADTLNQNSRVYPKKVLEREIMNYQKFIVENRALGECVPAGTEIFTSEGWKNIEDIFDDEVIFTLNLGTGLPELQKIDRKVVLPFDKELFHIKNNANIDMKLTPNHNVLLWSESGEAVKMTAKELCSLIVEGRATTYELRNLTQEFVLGDSISTSNIRHSGNVYCVTVQNSTWLMRQGDFMCWTHNCDHPDSSVISLQNVSHIVREAYMDGNNVYGVIEVLPTPCGNIIKNLVDSGVKIGVSSRGVGSTKKDGDVQVVQDDFVLICFDVVSEPSTISAFLMPEGKSIVHDGKPLSRDELLKSFNRHDRIDRIINELL